MNKIDTYLVEHIYENEFQNIDVDRDASKLNIKIPSFLEHTAWDQRVNNKLAYSDSDHRRGIKALSPLELPSQLQTVQFLVECQQKLSRNSCEDKVVELIQSFQVQDNLYSLASIVVDLATAFYRRGHVELIWELNKFLPSCLRFLQEDITPTVDESLVQDNNGMVVNKNEISLTETITVMWYNDVPANLKEVIKNRTRIGLIEGMPKAMLDIILDLGKWDYWVQFSNGSVKAMTENLDYINIYEDYQQHFPSLAPFFACIHSLHNNSCKYAGAVAWIQKSEKSGEVVVGKHWDKKSPEEAQKEHNHGQDFNQYRMVIQVTSLNGPHCDQQKTTCFGVT